jgi:hypothetical protein
MREGKRRKVQRAALPVLSFVFFKFLAFAIALFGNANPSHGRALKSMGVGQHPTCPRKNRELDGNTSKRLRRHVAFDAIHGL